MIFRRIGVVIFAMALVACTTSSTLAMAAQHNSQDTIIGDDEIDAYRGEGGLILPGSFTGSNATRRKVATCLGCRWRYTFFCRSDAGQVDACTHLVTTCPRGTLRYRVQFSQDGDGGFHTIGSVCHGSGDPETRKSLESRIRIATLEYLPLPDPDHNPSPSLPIVPVAFATGGISEFKKSFKVGPGLRADLRAIPIWVWEWGDSSRTTTRKVSHLPVRGRSATLVHQYRRPGDYRVMLTTIWEATYEIPGVGKFEVTQDITTVAFENVRILDAHSVLTAGAGVISMR